MDDSIDSCWTWSGASSVGSRNKSPYGSIRYQGKTWKVHRLSYVLFVGKIPSGMQVDHRCHETLCVRPSHLRLATNAQNQQNRVGPTVQSSSGVRGVYRHGTRWRVRVGYLGSYRMGGNFSDLEEARLAAISLRNEMFTHNDSDRWNA